MTTTYAVIGAKGGIAKTATSMGLAGAWAERDRRVLVVDADPQGSALKWSTLAGDALGFEVVALPVPDLARRLRSLSAGYDAVVIDGPPGSLEITRGALLAADLALVPVSPSLSEVHQMGPTMSLLLDAAALNERLAVLVVLTRVRASTNAAKQVRGFLEGQGHALADVAIPLRQAIADGYGTGVVHDAYRWLADELDQLDD
ncbi:MAG: ParA family protein [Acidimicrobiia bacterium]|jgi:chromosome partitioning protein|nr:ParA family protein [Acidimicrobiia bacterium]